MSSAAMGFCRSFLPGQSWCASPSFTRSGAGSLVSVCRMLTFWRSVVLVTACMSVCFTGAFIVHIPDAYLDDQLDCQSECLSNGYTTTQCTQLCGYMNSYEDFTEESPPNQIITNSVDTRIDGVGHRSYKRSHNSCLGNCVRGRGMNLVRCKQMCIHFR